MSEPSPTAAGGPAGLRYERIDDLAVLTMDDGKANALGPALLAELDQALDRAESDGGVSAVVLAGRPEVFCGGFDLKVIQGGDPDAVAAMVRGGGALVRRIYGSPLPVVAACTGHAVAAGALLLLACDVRVGPESDARLGLNEVAIGLTLPPWALAIAADRLSFRHRQRAVVNAVLYSGSDAVDAGFLDRVVPADEVVAAAVSEATALARLDRAAYAATVAAFRGATLAAMGAD